MGGTPLEWLLKLLPTINTMQSLENTILEFDPDLFAKSPNMAFFSKGLSFLHHSQKHFASWKYPGRMLKGHLAWRVAL